MSKTLLLALGILSIAQFGSAETTEASFLQYLQEARIVEQDWSPNGLNLVKTRYYFAATRGLLEGFQRGLFNNKTFLISPGCMDETTV